MGSRTGSRGVTVKTIGLQKLDAFLRDQIAAEDLNPAKKELRQGTKVIGNDVVIPALKAGAEASGVPQAPAMAATARVRSDRIVFVRIGGVNPKLSGFKRGIGPARRAAGGKTSQSHRTSLAWGSDKGPHPDARAPKDGKAHAGAPANRYSVARRDGGYWVVQSISKVVPEVREQYNALLGRILNSYGRYR
jgi:hypothetical protein